MAGAPIIKLDAAKAAVVQAASGQLFQQVQESREHGIDAIGGLEPHNAVRAALRATGLVAEVEAEAAWNELLHGAVLALVNRHVTETFEERSVDAP
jgi:hypothetical protein